MCVLKIIYICIYRTWKKYKNDGNPKLYIYIYLYIYKYIHIQVRDINTLNFRSHRPADAGRAAGVK